MLDGDMTALENQETVLSPPPGHPRLVQTLEQAVRRGQVHHAYLFSGPLGVGKFEMAQWFAANLLCEEPVLDSGASGSVTCGKCPSCHGAQRGEHADLEIVKPPEDRQGIGIAQVRELIRKLSYAPLRAKRRVIVIHEASSMGEVPSNALLKTLEEPAPYNVFILTTNRLHSLLDTIRSRCQIMTFEPLPLAVLLDALKGMGIGDDTAHIVASASGGSLGFAAELAREGFVEDSERWLEDLLNPKRALPPGEVLEIAAAFAADHRKQGSGADGDLSRLFRTLRFGLRDGLLVGEGLTGTELTWPQKEERSRSLYEKLGTGGLMSLMDRVQSAEEALYRPLNTTLVVEDLLLRIRARIVR